MLLAPRLSCCNRPGASGALVGAVIVQLRLGGARGIRGAPHERTREPEEAGRSDEEMVVGGGRFSLP